MLATKIIVSNHLFDNFLEQLNTFMFLEKIMILLFKATNKRFHINIFFGSILLIGKPSLGIDENFINPAMSQVNSILVMMNNDAFYFLTQFL